MEADESYRSDNSGTSASGTSTSARTNQPDRMGTGILEFKVYLKKQGKTRAASACRAPRLLQKAGEQTWTSTYQDWRLSLRALEDHLRTGQEPWLQSMAGGDTVQR